MEHVEWLEGEQVVTELILNRDQYSFNVSEVEIRYLIKLANSLGIKFYRSLGHIEGTQ